MSTSAFRGWLHPISLDAELMSILPEAVEDMELDWVAPEQPSKRWMDGSFLGASSQTGLPQRPAPFLPELHEELTCSIGQTPIQCHRSTLCALCKLRAYVNRTSQFRSSEQLFVCFAGAPRRGACC